MHAITKTVYIEDQYPGVLLGVIRGRADLIQVDAPPSPEDSRTWRATLMNLNAGPERVLINLDAHPDRTLGARAMDCTVIAHEKAARALPHTPHHLQGPGRGDRLGMGGHRRAWQRALGASGDFLRAAAHPALGGQPGRDRISMTGLRWVLCGSASPEEKIVFIGDAVVKNQPALPLHGRPARVDRIA